MLSHLIQLLSLINKWFRVDNDIKPDLVQISQIEKEADNVHLNFLFELYQKDLKCKELRQAEVIDQIIEDCIDEAERLAKRIYVILYQYKISSSDPPTYLS